LLANRLQKIILKLVHINQYGFLKERSIHDCLGWAFEYLHQCHLSKQEIIVAKLDFDKVFELIEDDLILKITKARGFSQRWIGWIKSIFDSATSAVLLNGTPRKKIIAREELDRKTHFPLCFLY
jgi:hypothetical protein